MSFSSLIAPQGQGAPCPEERLKEAIGCYSEALKLKPAYAEAHYNLGCALSEGEELESASACYRRALHLRPHYPEAHNNLGAALRQLGRPGEAIASLRQAIALRPGYAEAHNMLGLALRDLGFLDEALASYRQAVHLNPAFAEAHNNLGILLRADGQIEAAADSYRRALDLKPEFAEAAANLGNTLKEMGQMDAALSCYRQELQAAALNLHGIGAWVEECVNLLSIECQPAIFRSEEELSRMRNRIEQVLAGLAQRLEDTDPQKMGERAVMRRAATKITGFYIAYHQQNDRPLMERLSTVLTQLLGILNTPPAHRPGGRHRIRLGIASHFLRNHNAANWAYGWLSHLPKADYEFFTYCFQSESDDLSRRFAALGTHRTLRFDPMAFETVVNVMRADDLDFLMLPDVGMTSVSRILSLHRIARTQFTAWGHPVTTGSTQMDFFLSSDLMEPEGAQAHYSERLLRLPNLALYLDPCQQGLAEPAPRLREDRILYGCLQSLFKYLPRYDDLFPRIALEVPKALFVFLEGKPSYMTAVLRERLQGAFRRFGLDADRFVLFLPRRSSEDFNRLMRSMDVVVDSLGWSGGNTSLAAVRDALPPRYNAGRLHEGQAHIGHPPKDASRRICGCIYR